LAKESEKLCLACPASYPAAYSTCPRCQLPLVFPVIGKVWYVDSLIGRGGMGAVFSAHHIEDRRKRAAVKVLAPVAGELKAERADRMARFQREAAAMRRLTHVNIVQLFDFLRERDGSLYLAMEFLEGDSLAKLLKQRGALPGAEATGLVLPVLSALEAAHKVGVIHRDLKPDNIVLSRVTEGKQIIERIKVVDFGVARLKGDSVTDAGQALGTPVYMAPEQAQGSDIDERVDIYGVGAVLYELLTGRPPFTPPESANPNLAVLALIMTTDPEPPRSRNPEVSVALESVVLRAMCRDREQRYTTAGEFAAALQAALDHPEASLWSRPASTPALALPPAIAAAAQAPLVPASLRVSRSAAYFQAQGIGGATPAAAQPVPPVSRSSISNPPVVRSSQSLPPLSSRSLSSAPALPGRSLSSVPALPSRASASSTSLSPPSPAQPASRAYKLLIVAVYLGLVSILLVVLLFDRASCR
jgi:serine/threonine-protein kinase